MQKISAFLLLLLLLGLTGCEEKTPDDTPMPVENTTDVVTKDGRGFKLESQGKDSVVPAVQERFFKPGIPTLAAGSDTFILGDTKGRSYKVTISNEKVIFHDNAKPIELVNLFATWCPPCVGQLDSLNDLYKKHEKDLFVTGILTHDSIDKTELNTFLAKNQLNYFVSNSPHNDAFATLLASTLNLPENFSIPLTVLYVNGKYFTHYEGAVPAEMIEYDIQQAEKQLAAKHN